VTSWLCDELTGSHLEHGEKFWQHQTVKFDFAADLTGTANRSEEVIVIMFVSDS